MQRASSFHGKLVIGLGTGSVLGRVRRVVSDLRARRMGGLVVREDGDAGMGGAVVLGEQVASFGQDAIMVHGGLVDPGSHEAQDLWDLARQENQIYRTGLFTTSGTRLGYLIEPYYELQGGLPCPVAFEVFSESLFRDRVRGILLHGDHITLGQDLILVPEDLTGYLLDEEDPGFDLRSQLQGTVGAPARPPRPAPLLGRPAPPPPPHAATSVAAPIRPRPPVARVTPDPTPEPPPALVIPPPPPPEPALVISPGVTRELPPLPTPEPPPPPAPEPEPTPAFQPAPAPEPEPTPVFKPAPAPEPEPTPVFTPPPAPEPEPTPVFTPPPAPEPEPERIELPAPEPAPASTPSRRPDPLAEFDREPLVAPRARKVRPLVDPLPRPGTPEAPAPRPMTFPKIEGPARSTLGDMPRPAPPPEPRLPSAPPPAPPSAPPPAPPSAPPSEPAPPPSEPPVADAVTQVFSDPMITDEGESLSDVLGDFAGPAGNSMVGSEVGSGVSSELPGMDSEPPPMDSEPPPPASEPPAPPSAPAARSRPPREEPSEVSEASASAAEQSTIEALEMLADDPTGDTDSILASQVTVSDLIEESQPPASRFSLEDLAEKDQKVARFVLGKRASRDLEASGKYIVHRGDSITEDTIKLAVDNDMLTLLFLAASDGG